ncbi:efflux RND transporter periplasmic adaptor subunit [Hymenobacter sp. BT175]|uniref:efflux RND transporter periplasmic adaptor subunit n=1 Tax=Hymenobacter TaxID=89966 RepID=UPI0016511482|nr:MULTISPECIES: efflux RND transporter periplasmic adaptor subunit [Hymenobacter]MBC6700275.1 efflux RND transporter periplasmic adaptor subunit [Hymenobacter sp. BT190]MCC2548731.1 efflux RND transporter periplasmic adaptor subunit [Hymenobacter translucens]MCR5890514.1 efflux RND transporter periplasmic adaptor subunit [Hymenobacter sp. J193]MCR5890609.1 efflux RND transporter periplasmic adaptor subunit [Hymenobacter sp. J193]
MNKIASLLLLLSLTLAGCGADKKETAEAEPAAKGQESGEAGEAEEASDMVTLSAAEQQAAGLKTARLTDRPMGAGLAVTGTLDVPPESTVNITAPLGGFVENTELLQGARVRKGEVLATIRNPEFVTLQQDYLETRARLDYARTELARQKELYEQEVAPQKNYQRAQADYRALQVQTNAQAARLRLAGLPVGGRIVTTASLRAPRAGFVRTVNVTVGQAVTATDALFEIVDPEHLHVELTVFERDVARVQKNQLIRFTLASDSAGSRRERTARVYLVGKAIGEDRTVRVHGHLDQENDPALLPGLYVRALIETGRTQAPTLPDAALVRFEGKNYAFAVEAAGRYRLVPVTLGRSEDNFTEVTLPEGVAATTTFVTDGAYSLLAKMKNAEEEE